MSIVVGAETVDVIEGGHVLRRIPLATPGRSYDGAMLSAITSARGHTREWSLQFPPMLIADVESLEAELDGPGSVTISGSLINSTNIDCFARNVQREMDSLVWARVSCDLVEDDWTYAGTGYSVEVQVGDTFSVSDSDDDSLRFKDLGSGTFEVDASGTITAKVTTIGRFKVED